MPLEEFLTQCLNGVRGLTGLSPSQELFIATGVSAVDRKQHNPWYQLGLDTKADRRTSLYGELACLARTLLVAGTATNFFFMHKEPGLRIRFESVSTQSQAELRQRVDETVTSWLAGGLVRRVTPGCYEPEETLFGGALSMCGVHRFFTADSLGWLDHHRCQRPEWPSWLVSLHAIRALLEGLHIVGWEDLGVWSVVRTQGGRRLPAPVLQSTEFRRAATGVQAAWEATQQRSGQDALPSWLTEYRNAVEVAAREWHGCFDSGTAELGPRAAAAMAVVFHWNRAALPMPRQALLTEALVGRYQ